MFRRFLSSRIWFSAQDHAVLVLLLNLVVFFISTWPCWSVGNVLYHSCTSFEGASWDGQPLNIFTWFIGAGEIDSRVTYLTNLGYLSFWNPRIWLDYITKKNTYENLANTLSDALRHFKKKLPLQNFGLRWSCGAAKQYSDIRVPCSRSMFPQHSTHGTSCSLFLFPQEFGERPTLLL